MTTPAKVNHLALAFAMLLGSVTLFIGWGLTNLCDPGVLGLFVTKMIFAAIPFCAFALTLGVALRKLRRGRAVATGASAAVVASILCMSILQTEPWRARRTSTDAFNSSSPIHYLRIDPNDFYRRWIAGCS